LCGIHAPQDFSEHAGLGWWGKILIKKSKNSIIIIFDNYQFLKIIKPSSDLPTGSEGRACRTSPRRGPEHPHLGWRAMDDFFDFFIKNFSLTQTGALRKFLPSMNTTQKTGAKKI